MLIGCLASTLGCRTAPSVACEDAEQVIAGEGDQALTCGDANQVYRHISALAGRRPSSQDKGRLPGLLVLAHRADAAGTLAKVQRLKTELDDLQSLKGLAWAEKRAGYVWETWRDKGPITSEDGALWTIYKLSLAVWETDDEQRLAMTEGDVEGWIYYASLCREVQGGTPLLLSVADRVSAYRVVRERWEASDRASRVAMAAVGPFWRNTRDRWTMASYDKQQAWIRAAPLPPPMTATSLGYLEGLMQHASPATHVQALHDTLGPLTPDVPL